MKNSKVLEMINNGEIEELKRILEDEIYKESLKMVGGSSTRYAAMKRFYKFQDKNAKAFTKHPAAGVKIGSENYNVFCDNYVAVSTREDIGNMETVAKEDCINYEPIFINSSRGEFNTVDFKDVLARAKAKGYKYKKSEIGNEGTFEYCFKYKEAFFKLGLLDKGFSIIDDGDPAKIEYLGVKSGMRIETSVGKMLLLPFHFRSNKGITGKTVIEVA